MCLIFPSGIPIESWWCWLECYRANGESHGGYILCLTTPEFFEHKPARIWVIDWSSKKLRWQLRHLPDKMDLMRWSVPRVAPWSVVEYWPARKFRDKIPLFPSALVAESTKSCCSAALSVEGRLAIDHAIAKETMANQNIIGCWANNLQIDCRHLDKAQSRQQTFVRPHRDRYLQAEGEPRIRSKRKGQGEFGGRSEKHWKNQSQKKREWNRDERGVRIDGPAPFCVRNFPFLLFCINAVAWGSCSQSLVAVQVFICRVRPKLIEGQSWKEQWL